MDYFGHRNNDGNLVEKGTDNVISENELKKRSKLSFNPIYTPDIFKINLLLTICYLILDFV